MIDILDEIIAVLYQNHGLDISGYDQSYVVKSLEKRLIVTGVSTASAYIGYLAQSASEAQALFCSLNNTYSYFFRNILAFALLEEWILPKLINEKAGGEIRVWSAGCASGQEPYSIAMLLDKFNSDRANHIRFRIFATDTSAVALTAARAGVYDIDALQNVRLKYLREYFTQQDETFLISSHIKEHVSFSTYDLLDELSSNPEESIYGDFDLVFCSNLLFYYRAKNQKNILQKIVRSMSANGHLVTGEAERFVVGQTYGLYPVIPSSVVFKKGSYGGFR